MFVKYTINPVVTSGETTINIPISIDYQIVDNSELVEREFVDIEVNKAINPILDYDKVRFMPVDNNFKGIGEITYNINFLNSNNGILIPTYYSNIGIDDFDIKYRKNYFKESYLNLSFYDSDNVLTQTFLSEINIYSHLASDDFYGAGTQPPNISGQPKPASQIPVRLRLSNPLTTRDGFFEGYHIYSYKDDLVVGGTPKNLFMRASYFNAKTGKMLNLMTEPSPFNIETLITKLHTKYTLFRDSTGYYYELDESYSTNVSHTTNANTNLTNLAINLYQIQVL